MSLLVLVTGTASGGAEGAAVSLAGIAVVLALVWTAMLRSRVGRQHAGALSAGPA